MDINFSKLKENDLEKIAELYDHDSNKITNREKMKRTFLKLKDNESYYLLVARINNEVVGFIKANVHYDIFEDNRAFLTLWSIRVKEEYRKQGIGKKMLQYIEKIAIDLNCQFISLICDKDNIAANSLYKSEGYKMENGFVKFLE